ncbi:MAG: 30S ribosomal protein S16 [Candidatus Nomurabacteria bacterium]|nr:MAG: 30S ribosomal protein S16 [Candidatus Nomurabacteria bacterium]HRV76208.1 30S ribosomal protein S16 [Candidatus Saccharimonadales bacterium]
MLVIRLQRRGRKGLAQYRIVVQDKRTHPTKEKVVARLGNYNPHTKELVIDKDLAQKFVDNGAQPSERVAQLLKKEKVKLPKWVADATKKEGKTRNVEKLRKNQQKEEISDEAPTESKETPEVSEESSEATAQDAPESNQDTEETSTEA